MAEIRWTVAAATEATGATVSGSGPATLAGVATDTRQLRGGELFVALAGERFDGHDFIETAWAAGAAAVLVSRPVPVPAGRWVLEVPDTLVGYGQLARWWREQLAPVVIGVTGSTGKSSTKELCAAVMAQRLEVLASQASFNNEIGLPATLLQLGPQHQAVVLEMAMRGPGQVAYLADIARPKIGVITNIGSSHVGLLGSREAIAQAKGELLEALGSDGVAVLNADDSHLPRQAERHCGRVLWYGLGPAADVRAVDVRTAGLQGSRFRLQTPRGGSAEVHLALPGRHMVANALAAATVALAAGLTPDEIAAGLAAARRLPQRLEVVALANGARVINDAYNAAPDSVRAALQVAADEPAERRIAVLGDMLEMGDLAETEHLALGHDVATTVDLVVGVGELGQLIAAGARDVGHGEVYSVPDVAAAGELLRGLLRPGDLVLLKASRAMGLERVLSQLEKCS